MEGAGLRTKYSVGNSSEVPMWMANVEGGISCFTSSLGSSPLSLSSLGFCFCGRIKSMRPSRGKVLYSPSPGRALDDTVEALTPRMAKRLRSFKECTFTGVDSEGGASQTDA